MRLALLAALGVVAMHAVHLALGNRIAARALLEAQARVGSRLARLVAEQADDPLLVSDVMTLYGLVHSAAADAGDVNYCFIVRDGRVVASSFEGSTPEGLVRLRGAGDVAPVLVTLDGDQVLDLSEPILGGSLGQVRLGLGMQSLRRLRHELAVHLGELAVAVIGLGLVAAFVAGRAIARPVREMLAAADRFDPAGDGVGPVVAAQGSDEVAVLGKRFNSMMRRLEAAHAEQRRARQKAVETERLAALGSLVAGVAHEVNNPLAGLKNCLRRLERGDLPQAKQREYLALMEEGLSRIEEVVRRLLDYGRPHPTRLEPVSARSLATDAARLVGPLLERRGVTSPVLADAVDAQVLADRRQVGQAVINLLLNAAYVTPDGGEVRVSLRRRDGLVGIAVADDGPGIPVEIRDRILDPFFSTKPEGEGTGLGLSVTRTIADAHGGELGFEFPERGGTIAVLWLQAVGPAEVAG
jgi:two-component system, NtrC family, sensor kinase